MLYSLIEFPFCPKNYMPLAMEANDYKMFLWLLTCHERLAHLRSWKSCMVTKSIYLEFTVNHKIINGIFVDFISDDDIRFLLILQVYSLEDGPVHDVWRTVGIPVTVIQAFDKTGIVVDWLKYVSHTTFPMYLELWKK